DTLDTTDAKGCAVLKGLTTDNGFKFNTSKLTGTYQIVELKEKSTYNNDGSILADSKAVPVKITLPLVNDNGVVKDAHVYPKNTETKPQVDKNFAD
ncbi:pilin N-terminal domain-containing protein, partial [Acinetobacter baumannii]